MNNIYLAVMTLNRIVSDCNEFLKDCGLTYAFCGGYALELFLNKKLRTHSDIDISVFEEDKEFIIKFLLNKRWNIYEHKADWIDNIISNTYLRSIQNSNDENVSQLHSVWAIKPDCSFFKIEPKPGEENIFNYAILNEVQLNFDFIEIIFNKQQDNKFICDKTNNISRELDKTILYNDGIPYLAPELMLFIISNPAYIESDYHRVKNQIDFNSTAPFLPKSSKDWLINALETAYPQGNQRLEQLKNFK